MRILTPERIPTSLWNGTHIIVPFLLSMAYKDELLVRGLFKRAVDVGHRGSIGGETEEDALSHFSDRFANSVGRAIYCLSSPCETFTDVSNTFLSVFSHGHVALLDIPCGTGAFGLSLISLLIELREQSILPSLPLTVTIVGGDFSETARAVNGSMVTRIAGRALTQGIEVRFHPVHWDAEDDEQTARMVDIWFRESVDATEHIVAVLNFSGEMHTKERLDRFQPIMRAILSRLYDRNGAFLWIEPSRPGSHSNRKDKSWKLFNYLSSMRVNVPFLARRHGATTNADPREVAFRVVHPFTGNSMNSGVMLQWFDPFSRRDM